MIVNKYEDNSEPGLFKLGSKLATPQQKTCRYGGWKLRKRLLCPLLDGLQLQAFAGTASKPWSNPPAWLQQPANTPWFPRKPTLSPGRRPRLAAPVETILQGQMAFFFRQMLLRDKARSRLARSRALPQVAARVCHRQRRLWMFTW